MTHVLAPGKDGYLGILANHAPLVTSLDIGLVNYTPAGGGQEQLFAVANGFLEVSNNEVSLLADSAESWEDIDIDRAQEALKRAENRLAIMDDKIDIQRARDALRRAQNRIRVKEKRFTF